MPPGIGYPDPHRGFGFKSLPQRGNYGYGRRQLPPPRSGQPSAGAYIGQGLQSFTESFQDAREKQKQNAAKRLQIALADIDLGRPVDQKKVLRDAQLIGLSWDFEGPTLEQKERTRVEAVGQQIEQAAQTQMHRLGQEMRGRIRGELPTTDLPEMKFPADNPEYQPPSAAALQVEQQQRNPGLLKRVLRGAGILPPPKPSPDSPAAQGLEIRAQLGRTKAEAGDTIHRLMRNYLSEENPVEANKILLKLRVAGIPFGMTIPKLDNIDLVPLWAAYLDQPEAETGKTMFRRLHGGADPKKDEAKYNLEALQYQETFAGMEYVPFTPEEVNQVAAWLDPNQDAVLPTIARKPESEQDQGPHYQQVVALTNKYMKIGATHVEANLIAMMELSGKPLSKALQIKKQGWAWAEADTLTPSEEDKRLVQIHGSNILRTARFKIQEANKTGAVKHELKWKDMDPLRAALLLTNNYIYTHRDNKDLLRLQFVIEKMFRDPLFAAEVLDLNLSDPGGITKTKFHGIYTPGGPPAVPVPGVIWSGK